MDLRYCNVLKRAISDTLKISHHVILPQHLHLSHKTGSVHCGKKVKHALYWKSKGIQSSSATTKPGMNKFWSGSQAKGP